MRDVRRKLPDRCLGDAIVFSHSHALHAGWWENPKYSHDEEYGVPLPCQVVVANYTHTASSANKAGCLEHLKKIDIVFDARHQAYARLDEHAPKFFLSMAARDVCGSCC